MAHDLKLVGKDDEAVHLMCAKCRANARFGTKEGMVPHATVDGDEFAVDDVDVDKWLGACTE